MAELKLELLLESAIIKIKKSYKDEIEPRKRGVFYFYIKGEGDESNLRSVARRIRLLQGG
jgi:hypothetical protein